MNWEEACRILGIAPTAAEKEIHDQYLYKVQLLHPDWNLNKPVNVRKLAEEELKHVNAAYVVLKDSTNNPFSAPPKLEIPLKKIRFREVDFGQKKSTKLGVKSVGGAYSKIRISDSPAPWLRVTDVRSLTNELLPLEITIEATGSGEPNKHYDCKLGITLENEQTKTRDESAVSIELWMMAEPSLLKLKTKNVKFRFSEPGIPKLKGLEIDNVGRGWLQGHLFTTRPWLTVSPNLVMIAPSTRTIYTIAPATNTLPCGFVDKAFVNIITNGGNDRVEVELSIARFSLRKLCNSFLYFISLRFLSLPFSFLKDCVRTASRWSEHLRNLIVYIREF